MMEYYSLDDFRKLPKFDAHLHYHTYYDLFIRHAKKANMRLMSINTNFDFVSMDKQHEIAQHFHQRYPYFFDYIGTFDASSFASKTFVHDTVEQIKKCMTAGARGIKIWKNIGMKIKNEAGEYLMADDPVFDPIYAFLDKEQIPLLVHLGEPRNCWLPIERMSVTSDQHYFHKMPEFHAWRQPEIPSYEQQMTARDHILERFPNMIFIGAHLSSMEWNLDEVAKRLDKFPNFYIDISGRFAHIMEQTLRNRSAVIHFFETYKDRIIYGSDFFVSEDDRSYLMNLFFKCLPRIFMRLLSIYAGRAVKRQWLFFATDQLFKTENIISNSDLPKQIQGLKLSKNTIDRIFYKNACSIYFR